MLCFALLSAAPQLAVARGAGEGDAARASAPPQFALAVLTGRLAGEFTGGGGGDVGAPGLGDRATFCEAEALAFGDMGLLLLLVVGCNATFCEVEAVLLGEEGGTKKGELLTLLDSVRCWDDRGVSALLAWPPLLPATTYSGEALRCCTG